MKTEKIRQQCIQKEVFGKAFFQKILFTQINNRQNNEASR